MNGEVKGVTKFIARFGGSSLYWGIKDPVRKHEYISVTADLDVTLDNYTSALANAISDREISFNERYQISLEADIACRRALDSADREFERTIRDWERTSIAGH